MKHNLHQQVGLELSKLNSENVRVILDRACMNESSDIEIHNIPLFLNNKSSETELCNVDALIIKEGKVCVIIEIDESKTNPTQICGKYLTSAISNLYQYSNDAIEISIGTVLFVQFIDSTKFPNKSRKPNKLNVIQKKINKNSQGIVKNYYLFTDKEIDKALVKIRDYLN